LKLHRRAVGYTEERCITAKELERLLSLLGIVRGRSPAETANCAGLQLDETRPAGGFMNADDGSATGLILEPLKTSGIAWGRVRLGVSGCSGQRHRQHGDEDMEMPVDHGDLQPVGQDRTVASEGMTGS
jgi:hypothetical protein